MDRRAKQQLRLQQTVEGLSVAAIVYYLVGLVSIIAKGIKAGGVPLDAELISAIAVPLFAVTALVAVRRARRSVRDADAAPSAAPEDRQERQDNRPR